MINQYEVPALIEDTLPQLGRLYERGTPLVRKAVVDIILPELSREKMPDNISRIKLYSLIPASLYNQFMQYHLNFNHQ